MGANEDSMLGCYKIVGQLGIYLSNLSITLENGTYPIELLRTFRLVTELVVKLSNKL